jgi:membrane protein
VKFKPPKNLFRLFVEAAKAWSADYAPSMGAAISYYTVFSLAPLLVIVIAVAGAVFGRDAVTGRIVAEMRGLVGDQGASFVQSLVLASSNHHQGIVAGGISIVVLLLGATSVFTELQTALDRIWHVPASERPTGVRSILLARLLSFGVILALVFLLMVSLVVSAGLAAVDSWTTGLIPGMAVLAHVLNFALSLGVATALFAFIFKMLPSTHIAWSDVWVGAFTTAVLFELGKFLIGLYLGRSSLTQPFAAAGSLVVVLAWVYYAAQIFLLGAEFTKLYAHDQGSRQADAAAGAVATPALATVPAAAVQPAGSQHGQPVVAHPGHAQPPSPAIARLEETRHRLEAEVPVRVAELKDKATRVSTFGGAAIAVGAMALRLLRRRKGPQKKATAKSRPVQRRGLSRHGA